MKEESEWERESWKRSKRDIIFAQGELALLYKEEEEEEESWMNNNKKQERKRERETFEVECLGKIYLKKETKRETNVELYIIFHAHLDFFILKNWDGIL